MRQASVYCASGPWAAGVGVGIPSLAPISAARDMAKRTTPIRILLVDDASPVREAMRWALEDEAGLMVVGEAGDGKQALALAEHLAPDVVILDIELPALDGYAVATALKTLASPPLIIFLSVHSDVSSRQRAAEAGGDSFVEKGQGWPALIAQIRILFTGSDLLPATSSPTS